MNMKELNKIYETHIAPKAAEALEWVSIVLLLSAAVPTLLAYMSGVTDRLPPVDVVMFIWVGLGAYFLRCVLLKKQFLVITIGLGFFTNACLLALLLFR